MLRLTKQFTCHSSAYCLSLFQVLMTKPEHLTIYWDSAHHSQSKQRQFLPPSGHIPTWSRCTLSETFQWNVYSSSEPHFMGLVKLISIRWKSVRYYFCRLFVLLTQVAFKRCIWWWMIVFRYMLTCSRYFVHPTV